ncbi:amidohydrolase [Alkalihalophilus marmarensis]|uniref:amidohydrolase n=1 Tax=Alkalihalophilus marmarensis TaxID=521377 RepID=UPI002E23335D|nr:amidohydrolase [Alkalihalophilus marmarensis]
MGTLWWNGTFFTMRKEGETTDAVYVEEGQIIDHGSAEDLSSAYSERITEKVDIEGAYVYPGLVDSHLHMVGHGERLIRLDLSETTQASEMVHQLIKKVKDTPPGEWVFAEGWNENNFIDRKIFHRMELDEITTSHPMYLTRICRHAALVNSKALELAGITKDTPDPEGGVIVRDADGMPTGYLLDAATELVKSVIPPVDKAYVKRALQTAVQDMLRLGLVGGHTEDLNYYGGFKQTFDAFNEVINGVDCKFRAHLLVHHEAIDEMKESGYSKGEVTPYIELGPMKIFADGALGGRTALLSAPYTDDPRTSGVAMHQQSELENLVKRARDEDMPVAIHTIGDEALRLAIDAIEKYPCTNGRDRLIHVQVINQDLIERLKNLRVVLDIQPRFVAADFPWVMERLGEERLPYSFAWKTLIEEGLHCAGGSDAPIEPVDPLLGIHAAVTRKKPGETHEGYLPDQKLSMFEAVKLFTTGSASAIEKESERGLIAPGYAADFTVLIQNVFEGDPDHLLDAEVVMTVVDDSIMYQKNK